MLKVANGVDNEAMFLISCIYPETINQITKKRIGDGKEQNATQKLMPWLLPYHFDSEIIWKSFPYCNCRVVRMK